MPLETRPFDPAVYLDSDEACAAYMTEALETGDPAFIADALAVITRARAQHHLKHDADQTIGSPTPTFSAEGDAGIGRMLRDIHALGLRLAAEPARR
jgi:probable addiction module antidote protein